MTTRHLRAFALTLTVLTAGSATGCQPWTGDYLASFSFPFVGGTVRTNILQTSSTSLALLNVDWALHISVVGDCNWNAINCGGTVGSGSLATYAAPGCTFAVTGPGCDPAWGASFASDVNGTEITSSAGNVDTYTLDMSYWPPLAGPLTFPNPLIRQP